MKTKSLASCDLILYVIPNQRDLELLPHDKDLPLIGQNAFQIDFDRIHHVDKYRKKCVDITFNPNIQATSRNCLHFVVNLKQIVSKITYAEVIKQSVFKRYSVNFILEKVIHHVNVGMLPYIEQCLCEESSTKDACFSFIKEKCFWDSDYIFFL